MLSGSAFPTQGYFTTDAAATFVRRELGEHISAWIGCKAV